MKGLKTLAKAIMPLILTLALTSCITVRPEVILDFPTFPDPIDEEGNDIIEYDNESGNIIMPLWYFESIVRYVIYVDETEAIYRAYAGK